MVQAINHKVKVKQLKLSILKKYMEQMGKEIRYWH